MTSERRFLIKRICMTVMGLVFCAIAVGMFKYANFGVDPFQSLMSGIDKWELIGFGTMYLISNLILLLFAFVFDRTKIGLGTVLNLFLLGYVTDFSQWSLKQILGDTPDVATRCIFLVAGIALVCFSSAIYMTANMGVSAYDAVGMYLAEHSKIPYRYWRILTDFICVAAGVGIFLWAGGSWSDVTTIAGVGTIITAFFMGPLVDFFTAFVARPFLGMGKGVKNQNKGREK